MMQQFLKLNNELLNEYETTGVIDRNKDMEATRSYFLDVLIPKLRSYIDHEDKIKFLVEAGYYEKEVLEMYDMDFIVSLYEQAYAYKFRFSTFMSASKFYDSYAMKSRDGKEILERYEDRIVITALYLARGDKQLATEAVDAIICGYQPATPTFLNSGKQARGELVSCFILSLDDSMNSIGENYSYCLELSRLGGGVSSNLTDLRCEGDPIKGVENAASGVVPVAKQLEMGFGYSNQLGQRQGSGAVYLNIFHGDIEAFIDTKKSNADEKIRLATLSTGIVVPAIFFELMERDAEMALFSPYDIKKEYGLRMSEISITEMYYELLDNPKIRKLKYLNARDLYTEIKKSQFESGYPFEMNDDTMNNANPLKAIGRIKNTNLCTEIAQSQKTSVITDKNKPNIYGFDVSCNLGSIDAHAVCATIRNFGKFVDTATQLLSNVSDMTSIVNVPSVEIGNDRMNAIGLGLMNFEGHCTFHNVLYGSADSVSFADSLGEALDYYSLLASTKLAQKHGHSFEGFEISEYATGEYTARQKAQHIDPTPTARRMLGYVPVISVEMWDSLQKQIDMHGVYNAYRLAIAPTGSISYVRSCTASVGPVNQKVEIRDYQDSRTVYPMPFLTKENEENYLDAYEVSPFAMIDVYAALQKHVDQAISMTLYITDDWNTEMLTKAYYYAFKKGIKSVYYVRQKQKKQKRILEFASVRGGASQYAQNQSLGECEACSI